MKSASDLTIVIFIPELDMPDYAQHFLFFFAESIENKWIQTY